MLELALTICNVCLFTPAPTSVLSQGKGGNLADSEVARETKLTKPMFEGDLFYSIDDEEKKPLPKGGGVFLTLPEMKKHTLKILGLNGKIWSRFNFDCAQYKHGTKIIFESKGLYSAGWKTYPLSKDLKKCPWYSEKMNGS